MWRPSLKKLPSLWREAIVLAAVFSLGALFDSLVLPSISRDVGVWTIKGVKGRGCEGRWGATMLRFGRHYGQVDGAYQIACGELSHTSETTALLCQCD